MIFILTWLWLIYPILEATAQGLLYRYDKKFGRVKGYRFYLQLSVIRAMAFILWVTFVVEAQDSFVFPLLGYAVGCHFAIFYILLNWYRGDPWDYGSDIPMPLQLAISGGLICCSLGVLKTLGYFN